MTLTFGCGDFLPGRGPFNFPDFIEGGTVNGPDPPDPDPPGNSTNADPTDPTPTGGGEGGPSIPGPPTPGPGGGGGGGPTTPGAGPAQPTGPGGGGGGGGPLSPGAGPVQPTGPGGGGGGGGPLSPGAGPVLPTGPGGGGGGGGGGPLSPGAGPVLPGGPGGGGGGGGGPLSPGAGPVQPGGPGGGGGGPLSPGAGPAQPFGPGGGGGGGGPLSPGAGPVQPGGPGGGGGPFSPGPLGPQAPGPGPTNDPFGGATNVGDQEEEEGLEDPFGGEGTVLGLQGGSGNTSRDISYSLGTSTKINLSNPTITKKVLAQRPTGFEDEEVFFDTTRRPPTLEKNTYRGTDIFKEIIDSNILYLLNNQTSYGDWDSRRASGVTPTTVYQSLNEDTLEILSKIFNYDRTSLTRTQIFNLIGSRILDGTIKTVNKGYLRNLAKASQEETPLEIIRSSSEIVNESIALGLIEKNYYPLEPSSSLGRASETLKNKKILSSDVDKFIPVSVSGKSYRYYVNDDDTFVGRSTLSIQDGDYFDITLGGKVQRVYTGSERDHAFFIPEKTRQIAVNLLGGDSSRTLTVSGDASSVELDYSLSAPRKNIYFLSAVLSSVDSNIDQGPTRHLKRTTIEYTNVSLDNIEAINEYIKYKDNQQTFILSDEDLILDYVEAGNSVFMSQTDVIVDSPKENKTIPLLTRQIPWYILLYPTNKPEYNPFNGKSRVVNVTRPSGSTKSTITRQLRTKTSITPQFRNKYNQFISVNLAGKGGRDSRQNLTNQARINKLNLNNKLINAGYVTNDRIESSAEDFSPRRPRTGYRLIAEIISDLNTNYLLGLNGVGKSLTEFDVFCRLNSLQFSKLSRLEGFEITKKALFNGLIEDVKVTPATKNADSKIAIRKSQLVRRRADASDDRFPEVKSTNFRRAIAPPTTSVGPEFVSFKPATPPLLLP